MSTVQASTQTGERRMPGPNITANSNKVLDVDFCTDKNSKTENSNLHGFQLHRPPSKGTKLLFQVIKAIINQYGTSHQ